MLFLSKPVLLCLTVIYFLFTSAAVFSPTDSNLSEFKEISESLTYHGGDDNVTGFLERVADFLQEALTTKQFEDLCKPRLSCLGVKNKYKEYDQMNRDVDGHFKTICQNLSNLMNSYSLFDPNPCLTHGNIIQEEIKALRFITKDNIFENSLTATENVISSLDTCIKSEPTQKDTAKNNLRTVLKKLNDAVIRESEELKKSFKVELPVGLTVDWPITFTDIYDDVNESYREITNAFNSLFLRINKAVDYPSGGILEIEGRIVDSISNALKKDINKFSFEKKFDRLAKLVSLNLDSNSNATVNEKDHLGTLCSSCNELFEGKVSASLSNIEQTRNTEIGKMLNIAIALFNEINAVWVDVFTVPGTTRPATPVPVEPLSLEVQLAKSFYTNFSAKIKNFNNSLPELMSTAIKADAEKISTYFKEKSTGFLANGMPDVFTKIGPLVDEIVNFTAIPLQIQLPFFEPKKLSPLIDNIILLINLFQKAIQDLLEIPIFKGKFTINKIDVPKTFQQLFDECYKNYVVEVNKLVAEINILYNPSSLTPFITLANARTIAENFRIYTSGSTNFKNMEMYKIIGEFNANDVNSDLGKFIRGIGNQGENISTSINNATPDRPADSWLVVSTAIKAIDGLWTEAYKACKIAADVSSIAKPGNDKLEFKIEVLDDIMVSAAVEFYKYYSSGQRMLSDALQSVINVTSLTEEKRSNVSAAIEKMKRVLTVAELGKYYLANDLNVIALGKILTDPSGNLKLLIDANTALATTNLDNIFNLLKLAKILSKDNTVYDKLNNLGSMKVTKIADSFVKIEDLVEILTTRYGTFMDGLVNLIASQVDTNSTEAEISNLESSILTFNGLVDKEVRYWENSTKYVTFKDGLRSFKTEELTAVTNTLTAFKGKNDIKGPLCPLQDAFVKLYEKALAIWEEASKIDNITVLPKITGLKAPTTPGQDISTDDKPKKTIASEFKILDEAFKDLHGKISNAILNKNRDSITFEVPVYEESVFLGIKGLTELKNNLNELNSAFETLKKDSDTAKIVESANHFFIDFLNPVFVEIGKSDFVNFSEIKEPKNQQIYEKMVTAVQGIYECVDRMNSKDDLKTIENRFDDLSLTDEIQLDKEKINRVVKAIKGFIDVHAAQTNSSGIFDKKELFGKLKILVEACNELWEGNSGNSTRKFPVVSNQETTIAPSKVLTVVEIKAIYDLVKGDFNTLVDCIKETSAENYASKQIVLNENLNKLTLTLSGIRLADFELDPDLEPSEIEELKWKIAKIAQIAQIKIENFKDLGNVKSALTIFASSFEAICTKLISGGIEKELDPLGKFEMENNDKANDDEKAGDKTMEAFVSHMDMLKKEFGILGELVSKFLKDGDIDGVTVEAIKSKIDFIKSTTLSLDKFTNQEECGKMGEFLTKVEEIEGQFERAKGGDKAAIETLKTLVEAAETELDKNFTSIKKAILKKKSLSPSAVVGITLCVVIIVGSIPTVVYIFITKKNQKNDLESQ